MTWTPAMQEAFDRYMAASEEHSRLIQERISQGHVGLPTTRRKLDQAAVRLEQAATGWDAKYEEFVNA